MKVDNQLYERITCEQVEVGDRIARAKTHPFYPVVDIREGEKSRRLLFRQHAIRPNRSQKLWRLTPEALRNL